MIHVCYSNRTEQLLEELARRLSDDRMTGSLFQPTRLAVPNRNVETYLKLGLARHHGIAANIEVSFLRSFLARIAERAVPGARVIDARHTEGHLLALLHDGEFLNESTGVLAPVRDYLAAAGDAGEAVDRRRGQLAAELATLFDEYAVARPEMLAAWGARSSGEGSASEQWQRMLWRAIFAPGGLAAARAKREGLDWALLPALVTEASKRGLAERDRQPGRAVHIFGVSYMARGYHRMLAELGRHMDVRVYTLNPCREFWEDVETVNEVRRRLKKDGRRTLFPSRQEARQPGLSLGDDPLGLTGESEALPLRLWGRPGRENVRLLNQLTDGDFDGRFAGDPAPRTLLARLQNDVLDRVPPDHAGVVELAADDSIRVLPCPGLRRELEVVAAEIWKLVRADAELRLSDIAVVVPEACKDVYLAHVGAVFGEAHGLPHSVADLPLGGGNRLGEAMEMLVRLPTGAFTRRELLPLITHPSILARFPDANASDWVRLCDELGILHGADHRDHAGTYIERDLLNWDQGLRRLALGALMRGPRGGDETPVAVGGQQYLPADLPADTTASALSFALLVRSLVADARFAAGCDDAPRRRPLSEWLELIRGLLSSYLVPADDEEDAFLGRCLAALEELSDLDVATRAGAPCPVSYLVAAELAQRAWERIGGTRGQYLARGVTVASFVPMRAIPFRVVFVLGLGHGLFPAQPRRSQLDLRDLRRVAGDVSPREQDLYLFLETLLCARDRVVLSYVARNELTGEPLPPSSVLLELREVLAGYLKPAELAKIFDGNPPPLRRYDDVERLAAAPLARREHVAKNLGRSLRAALPAGTAMPDLRGLERGLSAQARATLEGPLGLHAPPPLDRRPAARPRIVVPLAAIRQFLEDPLQGSARFRLRMREVEGDEDLLEREDEAFETGALARSELLREALLASLCAGAADWERVSATYERLALREELAGRLPTGIFRAAERTGQTAILKGWWDDLLSLSSGGKIGARVTRFGKRTGGALTGASAWLNRDDLCNVRDAIAIEVPGALVDGSADAIAVEIGGRTELVVTPSEGAPGSLAFVCHRKDEHRDKDCLRGFIDHIALSAAGVSSGPHRAFASWSLGGLHHLHSARFRPLERERARAYLVRVVTAMLTGARDSAGRPTGVHDYLLPCEAVFDARAKGRDVAGAVERLKDAHLERGGVIPCSSAYGPVPEAVERHEPPPSAEAEAMVEDRFGLFFELREGDVE